MKVFDYVKVTAGKHTGISGTVLRVWQNVYNHVCYADVQAIEPIPGSPSVIHVRCERLEPTIVAGYTRAVDW